MNALTPPPDLSRQTLSSAEVRALVDKVMADIAAKEAEAKRTGEYQERQRQAISARMATERDGLDIDPSAGGRTCLSNYEWLSRRGE